MLLIVFLAFISMHSISDKYKKTRGC